VGVGTGVTVGLGVGLGVGVRVAVGVGTGVTVAVGDIGEDEEARGVTEDIGGMADSRTVFGVAVAPGSSVANLSHAARNTIRRANPTIRLPSRVASKIACARFLPTHLFARRLS
jgi:hypothetical protein